MKKLIKIISKSIFFPQWEGNVFCVYWWVWWGSWEKITVGYSGFRYVMINNLIALMSPLRNLIFLLIYVITKGHLFHLITHLHSIYCMWESCFVYLTSMHWLSAPRSSRNRLQFPSQSLLVSLLREHTFGHCGTLSLNNSSQRPKPNMPIRLPICIFTLPSACFLHFVIGSIWKYLDYFSFSVILFSVILTPPLSGALVLEWVFTFPSFCTCC